MATDETPTAPPALCFGGVAEAFDRGRPGYPREAVAWLTGDQPLTVLELGAGTGKLTEQLLALGHDVHATDPDPRMLERLTARFPELRVSQTTAEEIPAPDTSFDVVVAADCYQWFDHDKALPEIARVLKRTGTLALVRNVRDERIPWVKRLGNLIGRQERGTGAGEALEASPYFGPVDDASFKQWQTVNRETIQDLVRVIPAVATLEPTAQESKIGEVLSFYDDFGRGMDGMQLPYVTECFRAGVGIRPQASRPQPSTTTAPVDIEPDLADAPVAHRPAAVEPPTDDDSGVLLIDFR